MKSSNRGKKAFKNIIAGFSNEFVTIICSLILPKLILSAFGSSYNGIVESITQFISYIALMKAGIGGVTRAALYKPLAENNNDKINIIVYQTQRFLRKIALIFMLLVFIFAFVYPIYICKDFSIEFTSSLFIIISISTFFQYYFGLTYQMILIADQKQYIISYINILTTILNTIISAILIKSGFGIHFVKLGSAFIFILNPLFINLYVKRKYNIKKIGKGDGTTDLIKERWDAIGHELANFINNNTDVTILTIFTNLKIVSVYTVYNFVSKGIRTCVTNFITGFGAAFGNMYAKKEYKVMEENLGLFELIIFSLSTIAYGTMIVMIVSFVLLYTKGITDVDYSRPLFGFLASLAGAFSCYRIPYQSIVTAVGHYKQTRNGAFLEAIINITISIIGVIKFGLVGVIIGTLIAAIFRSTQYALYLSKNIIKRSTFKYIKHVLISLFIILLSYYLSQQYLLNIDSVILWIIKTIITISGLTLVTIITNFIFYKEDTILLIKKIKRIIKKGVVNGKN